MSGPDEPSVVHLPRRGGPSLRLDAADFGWMVMLLAVACAVSMLDHGFYDLSAWGALSLGAMVLLVALAWLTRPALTPPALTALGGLVLLVLLAFASMLWAESKDSAWLEANRLAFYAVAFLVVVLGVRERRTARLLVLILGSAALLTSIWLCASIFLGGGDDAFLTHRLNSPVGYINGTAGLLLMGVWPWLAYADGASTAFRRAAALGGAMLVAGTLVLTQSRAVVPAVLLSALAVVLAGSGRRRRGAQLALVAIGVAATLPWTLRVYSGGGLPARNLAPAHGLLVRGALSILIAALLCAGALHLATYAPPALRRLVARLSSKRVLLLGGAVALAVAIPVGAPWVASQYRAFTALHVNDAASVRFTDASGYRYDLWRVAVKEFRQHPLGGVGAGNYDTAYYRLRRNPEYIIQPHSLELQVAAELGVGGLIGLALFGGAIVWACRRSDTLASRDPLVKVAAVGVFTAWLAHTSVDWLFDIPGLTGMAMVAAALLVVPPSTRGSPAPARTRRSMALLAGALTVLALLAASLGRQYVAVHYQTQGTAQVASSPQKAIETLRRARNLDPYSMTTLYSLAAAYARLDDYSDARRTLLAAAAREPHNYVPPALLGDLAVRRGDIPLARGSYTRALSLNPRDPLVAGDLQGLARP